MLSADECVGVRQNITKNYYDHIKKTAPQFEDKLVRDLNGFFNRHSQNYKYFVLKCIYKGQRSQNYNDCSKFSLIHFAFNLFESDMIISYYHFHWQNIYLLIIFCFFRPPTSHGKGPLKLPQQFVSRLVCLQVSQYFVSKTTHGIFPKFYMKLEGLKGQRLTRMNFSEKF